MKSLLFFSLISSTLATDWPQWRGPDLNNHAPADAQPVTEWSAEKNVRWKTPIPGRGHSSPVIVDGKIYLTTGDQNKGTQSLISIERKTGKLLWEKVIHQGGFPTQIHRENSPASQTAQWDGTNILVVFQNDQKIKVTAVSPTGEIVWSKVAGDYLPSFQFGYGSTPVLYKDSLILVIGTENGGTITSLSTKNGNPNWTIPRAGHDYWATPVIATIADNEQLLISGINKFSSYNPATGKLNWETKAGSKSMCGSIVWHDDMIFASGGYPEKGTTAVMADGSNKVVWKNIVQCYEQSLLSHKGLIYAVSDDGRAHCWDAKTGDNKWSERIGRRGVMASPLAVGDHIYATLKDGSTIIFKAGPIFQKLAENQLGTDTYATPVALDQELFLRVGKSDRGNRQEFLYSLGN